MAAVTYRMQDRRAEADVEELPNGKFQGVVLIVRDGADAVPQRTPSESDSAEEALEEAKALAHRLLDQGV